MIKFNVKDGKLIIDTEILLVKEFREIWEDDTTPKKTEAIKDFMFIYSFCDEDSPFKDMDYEEKEAACRRNAYGDGKVKLRDSRVDLINNGVIIHEALNETSEKRLLKSLDNKIDQLRKYLDLTPITDDSLDKIFKCMQQIDKPLIAKRNTKDMIEKGIKSSKTRGDMSRSPNEKGMLSYSRT